MCDGNLKINEQNIIDRFPEEKPIGAYVDANMELNMLMPSQLQKNTYCHRTSFESIFKDTNFILVQA